MKPLMKSLLALAVLCALALPSLAQTGQPGNSGSTFYGAQASTTGPVSQAWVQSRDGTGVPIYNVGRLILTNYGGLNPVAGQPDIPDTWVNPSTYGFQQGSCFRVLSYFGVPNKGNWLSSSLDYLYAEFEAPIELVDYITVESFQLSNGTGQTSTFLFNTANFDDTQEGYVFCRQHCQQITIWAKRIPGDTNEDGVVDFTDFLVLSANYGNAVTGGMDDADINNDGTVNFADFLFMKVFYTGTIPDPT